MLDHDQVFEKARLSVATARAEATEIALSELRDLLQTATAEHTERDANAGRLSKRLHLAQSGRPAPDGSANEGHRVRELQDRVATAKREVVAASERKTAITNMIDDFERGRVSL